MAKRNANLKKILVNLKNKDNMISSNSIEILEKCSGGVSDLLKRNVANIQNSPVPVRYSPELRAFALTLHFYSPRAYIYIYIYMLGKYLTLVSLTQKPFQNCTSMWMGNQALLS